MNLDVLAPVGLESKAPTTVTPPSKEKVRSPSQALTRAEAAILRKLSFYMWSAR
jgi:hypothetical protein